MVGSYQYITDNPNQDIAFVEGSYNEEYKNFLKNECEARWQPEHKRWAIPKQYVGRAKALAKRYFDRVYFSRGGDYEEI